MNNSKNFQHTITFSFAAACKVPKPEVAKVLRDSIMDFENVRIVDESFRLDSYHVQPIGRTQMFWDFKPADGGELQTGHTLCTFGQLAEQLGMTNDELQKVLFAEVDEVVHVSNVGEFRRRS